MYKNCLIYFTHVSNKTLFIVVSSNMNVVSNPLFAESLRQFCRYWCNFRETVLNRTEFVFFARHFENVAHAPSAPLDP